MRRFAWIIPAAILLSGLTIAFWPKPDLYGFLRPLHPRETWLQRLGEPFQDFPAAGNGQYHVFEFQSPVTPEEVERIYTSHPGVFDMWYAGQLSGGPLRKDVTASLAAVEESWFSRQINAVKRMLGLG